jgi:hypothetical protein
VRYCIGENDVGRQILLTTRSTSGPFASLALRADDVAALSATDRAIARVV